MKKLIFFAIIIATTSPANAIITEVYTGHVGGIVMPGAAITLTLGDTVGAGGLTNFSVSFSQSSNEWGAFGNPGVWMLPPSVTPFPGGVSWSSATAAFPPAPSTNFISAGFTVPVDIVPCSVIVISYSGTFMIGTPVGITLDTCLTPPPDPRDCDFNLDGIVNLADYRILAAQWEQAPGTPSADVVPQGGNGIVDIKDLGFVTENWLYSYWQQAIGANPFNGAMGVDPNVILEWTPGPLATSHDIYLGTNFAKVNNGHASTYEGNVTDPNYTPGSLVNNQEYFWRIE